MLLQDFRLQEIAEYEEWYGQPHRAPDLQVGNYFLKCAPEISFKESVRSSGFGSFWLWCCIPIHMVFSFQTQLNKIELLENDLSHFDCTLETLILKFKFKFNLLTMEVGSIIIIIIVSVIIIIVVVVVILSFLDIVFKFESL